MFRATARALSADGVDPVGKLETEIELNKHNVKKLPISPLKKQVLLAFFDFRSNAIKDVGFLNFVNKAEQQVQLEDMQNSLARLLPLRDDDFIVAVRGLAYTLPPKDSLRITLVQAAEAAENNLEQRRDFAHKAVGVAAAVLAIATMLKNPGAGLVVAAAEVATAVFTDINTVLNNLLELYDSPYGVPVEGAASAEMTASYRR